MKKKKSHRTLWHLCFSVFLTLLCGTFSIVVFSYGFAETYEAILEDYGRQEKNIVSQLTLDVTEETTLTDIANLLYENHFIGSKFLFSFHSILSDAPLIKGSYTLTNSMSNNDILNLLTTPKEDTPAMIKLTIPEGYTLQQIANKVADLGIVSKDTFLEATHRSYDYDFLKAVPKDSPHPLEGYLFPDTYFVAPDTSAEELIMKMLDRFQQVSSQYTSHLNFSSYTLHDVLTIASIIEAEAKRQDERPLIAGVIYNRLHQGLKLQMCSTVQYALETRKPNLSLDDLATPSPYNTYLNEGLPVGPIGSPGESSLKAAFLPETHDYLFFVLNNPTEGSHSFSRTSEEHATNKAKYNQLKDQNFMD